MGIPSFATDGDSQRSAAPKPPAAMGHDSDFSFVDQSTVAPQSVDMSGTSERREVPATATEKAKTSYFPLYDTMRLYAGWLLAWYSIVYAVGSYQYLKPLPFHIPYADSLFLSPLVLSFTFASYLFLLLTSIHAITRRKKISAVILTIVGMATFLLYRMNIQ